MVDDVVVMGCLLVWCVVETSLMCMRREIDGTREGGGKRSYICLGDSGDFVVGYHASRDACQDESSTIPGSHLEETEGECDK